MQPKSFSDSAPVGVHSPVAAKEGLTSLLASKDVPAFQLPTLYVTGQDKYGRWLAIVMLKGVGNVNEEMIRRGWAVSYDGGKRE